MVTREKINSFIEHLLRYEKPIGLHKTEGVQYFINDNVYGIIGVTYNSTDTIDSDGIVTLKLITPSTSYMYEPKTFMEMGVAIDLFTKVVDDLLDKELDIPEDVVEETKNLNDIDLADSLCSETEYHES